MRMEKKWKLSVIALAAAAWGLSAGAAQADKPGRHHNWTRQQWSSDKPHHGRHDRGPRRHQAWIVPHTRFIRNYYAPDYSASRYYYPGYTTSRFYNNGNYSTCYNSVFGYYGYYRDGYCYQWPSTGVPLPW